MRAAVQTAGTILQAGPLSVAAHPACHPSPGDLEPFGDLTPGPAASRTKAIILRTAQQNALLRRGQS